MIRRTREKVFGPGRAVPLGRNAKARIMAYARAWGARHAQSGQHRGPIEADAEARQDRRVEAPRAGYDETILIVDDEPTVRTVITEVLYELGYAAIEVSDGASGLKVLQSDVRIDLLITDVGLPGGLNGRQMADAGRRRRPELPVLFITGYAESAAIGKGALGPGMYVMSKPFAMDVLASRIKSIIGGGC